MSVTNNYLDPLVFIAIAYCFYFFKSCFIPSLAWLFLLPGTLYEKF